VLQGFSDRRFVGVVGEPYEFQVDFEHHNAFRVDKRAAHHRGGGRVSATHTLKTIVAILGEQPGICERRTHFQLLVCHELGKPGLVLFQTPLQKKDNDKGQCQMVLSSWN
jgi:hypothetical protein